MPSVRIAHDLVELSDTARRPPPIQAVRSAARACPPRVMAIKPVLSAVIRFIARTSPGLHLDACAFFEDQGNFCMPKDQVTVDDVVAAAGVAKGTFYVHFENLGDLQNLVADDLAREFDELLQPRRLALEDPIERIAAGCGAFIAQALRNPAWGSLVAHSAAAMPSIAGVARKRLKEDIDRATRDGQLNGVTPDLAFDFANGIVLHAMQTASEKRLSLEQAPDVVAGILRAIGVAPANAAAVARRAIARGHRGHRAHVRDSRRDAGAPSPKRSGAAAQAGCTFRQGAS